MDSVSLVQAEQKAKELEDWKTGIENNPEAKKEMIDAAKEFSEEQGNKNEDLSAGGNVNLVVNPYPYWFGYPWWYNYPYWYPRPYYYDWGFYSGSGGFVFIGLPSPFFTNWYFSNHYHHYYYNHFSDYCIGHYYGHRNSHLGFNKEVRNWTVKNEPALPRGYLNNDPKRPERIKELGKFDIDYRNTNRLPLKKVSRDNFQQNNSINYPNLNRGKNAPVKVGPPNKPRLNTVPNNKPQSFPQNRSSGSKSGGKR